MSTTHLSRRYERLAAVLGITLITVLPGCIGQWEPITIIVVAKEIQPRWDSRVIGLQTGPSGRVVEIRQEQIVYEYWVKDIGGRWHQVSQREWQAAQLGEPFDLRP